MQEKACRKCGETKPLDAFSRDRSRPDGRRNACKACDVIHDANPAFKARRAEYNRSEAGKAAFRKYRRTERGAANSRKRYERVKDTPEYKRRMSGYGRKWARSMRGQQWFAKYAADPDRLPKRRQWFGAWISSPANLERKREHGRRAEHRRLARKKLLDSTLTVQEWRFALMYFEHRCAYCGTARKLLQEHFIPVRHGGPYTATNIVPACQSCNNRKLDKMPEQWCSPSLYAAITTYFVSLRRVV